MDSSQSVRERTREMRAFPLQEDEKNPRLGARGLFPALPPKFEVLSLGSWCPVPGTKGELGTSLFRVTRGEETIVVFESVDSPYLVPFDGSFRIQDAPTSPPPGGPGKRDLKKQLEKTVDSLDDLQRKLYADDHWGVLLVFQAMDAAGKDSTIRAVLRGVNPQGCQVSSFKQPSKRELDHDFLWRISAALPERGRIGVFNRSHYEEVLVVKVHPQYLGGQRLPGNVTQEERWEGRYSSIRDFEAHLARNGCLVLKFFLNVSREEQAVRFRRRIDRPDKNWKFSAGDLEERTFWDDYMAAYEASLNATSRPWAPWYSIPADDKPFLRSSVATIVKESLASLDLKYPEVDEEGRAELLALKNTIV
jgi:PPK2 family polyphosphate:nucleotide phosphotransferase